MDVPERIVAAMVDHARACPPEEACGLLAFDDEGTPREAYCLVNARRSSTAFTVDPDGHYASLVDAERRGWRLGGAFHSHPNSPGIPSRTDVAGALEPGWLHVVVGFAAGDQPEVRAWWIVDGDAVEEPLVTAIPSAAEDGPWR
jgi:proteasome lid subunit RPN8/RPN11